MKKVFESTRLPNQDLPQKENRSHGSPAYPCAYYQAISGPTQSAFRVRHHWHEELEILYFEKGSFLLEVNMQKYQIHQECFCFLNSGDLHSISADDDFQERAFVFSADVLSFPAGDPVQAFFAEPLKEQALFLPRLIGHEHPLFDSIKKDFFQIFSAFDEKSRLSVPQTSVNPGQQYAISSPLPYARIKAAVLNIFCTLTEGKLISRSAEQKNAGCRIELIKDVLSYMRAHAFEKIYVGDIAKYAGMNEQYFCRFFKSVIGRAPMEYLIEIRIKNACRLLEETDLSVMEISLESGFFNLGNFMRTFRSFYGCTPLQYRKKSR